MLGIRFSSRMIVFLEHPHLQCNPKRLAGVLQTPHFLFSEGTTGAPVPLTDSDRLWVLCALHPPGWLDAPQSS